VTFADPFSEARPIESEAGVEEKTEKIRKTIAKKGTL
jgi:hypothetical protein